MANCMHMYNQRQRKAVKSMELIDLQENISIVKIIFLHTYVALSKSVRAAAPQPHHFGIPPLMHTIVFLPEIATTLQNQYLKPVFLIHNSA